MMRFTPIYGYVKERSGEIGPGIKTVEEAVKSVVGPVHEKFHLVPDEILRHGDTSRSYDHAYQRSYVSARATALEMAVRLYDKCDPMTDKYVSPAWQKVKMSPVFPRVANAVLPKATYCTDKYNEAVVATTEKGCRVSAYLPLVHTETIVKLFH